jgi:ubiquinone/menaquinone biosynthesis C-methylase UbiE
MCHYPAPTTQRPITAVDIHQEYLDELRERAKAARVAGRIDILVGDMQALPFSPQCFDLIWAEGAAYIMGFGQALVAWKRFLKAGGYIVVSELVWLRPAPPPEGAAFFGSEYPVMTDVETTAATIRASGYEPRGHFTLPDAAWWEDYSTPLEAKLPSLDEKYASNGNARRILDTAKREIDMRRRFGTWYGYAFFVGRRVE